MSDERAERKSRDVGSLSAASACRYWLAEYEGPMRVRFLDGCHDSPEGVAKAAKLHKRIWPGESADAWVMVEVHPLPELDPPINEDAADVCRDLVEGRLS